MNDEGVTPPPPPRTFEELFPEQAKAAAGKAALSSVVYRDGRAVDILLGERPLYGGDAEEITAGQVKEFLEHPLRVVTGDLSEAGLMTPLCAKMVSCLMGEVRGTEMRMPDVNSTYLVIFGLGLGHHLEPLIRATRARWIVVVEPFPGLVAHSRDVVDWAEIAALLEDRDGAIELVTELDPDEMAGAISRVIKRHGASYIDGTWVYTHYPLQAFVEARRQLLAEADNLFAQCGFFEDELKMMRNPAANFSTSPFWLLSGERRPQRRETAVIVGAGPSLNGSLDKLREIRDQVVLFCGGTALRPLLRNGITPDFHCELENAPVVLEVVEEAGKHGDLSQITLIASATLDPRVGAMFKDRIFFFRENSSGTALMKGKYSSLRGCVPTCVNTALSAASFLGFTQFVLFGTDCGVRADGADHAEGTVYRDVWKDRPDIAKKYPMEIEGNFGGTVFTNWVYDFCRRILAGAINRFRLSVTNCSDGALIAGATPKVPEALEINAPPIDRERLFRELKKTLIAFQPGELLASVDLSGLEEKNREMYRELAEILDQFDPEVPDFGGVHAALTTFGKSAIEKYPKLHLIGEGTILALARLGMYFGSRIADEERRRSLNKVYLDRLRASFEEMERRTAELIEQLRERAAPFSSAGRAA